MHKAQCTVTAINKKFLCRPIFFDQQAIINCKWNTFAEMYIEVEDRTELVNLFNTNIL